MKSIFRSYMYKNINALFQYNSAAENLHWDATRDFYFVNAQANKQKLTT